MPAEHVEVLVGAVSVVGLRSVAAADPNSGAGLGYDINDAFNKRRLGDLDYPPSRPTVVARWTASLREETPSFR